MLFHTLGTGKQSFCLALAARAALQVGLRLSLGARTERFILICSDFSFAEVPHQRLLSDLFTRPCLWFLSKNLLCSCVEA